MKQAQVLSERDVKLMLAQIKRSSYSSRNRCMFLLALYSGMRVGELAALHVGDVVDGKGKVRDQIMLRPHQTKGRHARTVLLNTLAQVFGKLYRTCGLDAASSHSMRRTFCTRLAERGTSIHIIAALAGHRSVSTTMGYLAANANVMRNAVEYV